jgi:hypothetical protein
MVCFSEAVSARFNADLHISARFEQVSGLLRDAHDWVTRDQRVRQLCLTYKKHKEGYDQAASLYSTKAIQAARRKINTFESPLHHGPSMEDFRAHWQVLDIETSP